LGNLGRIGEAVPLWKEAAELGAGSIAWRNLGLVAAVDGDVQRAEECFRRAIVARPDDQTLYRDLAEILVADQRRVTPLNCSRRAIQGQRRGIIVLLANRGREALRAVHRTANRWRICQLGRQDITWRFNQRTSSTVDGRLERRRRDRSPISTRRDLPGV
jgi:tetratricopeptide (TPR) repeat protein